MNHLKQPTKSIFQRDTLPKFNSEFAPEKLPFHPIGKAKVFLSHHVSGANC